MSRDIDQIKEKLSIIDVVGGYIKIEKKGRYFKAKCPFHNENTASFTVTPERDMYHCFGCGKGGDIFAFVQEMEGMDFREALKLLAQKAGVTLSQKEKGQFNEKTELYKVLDMATKFYEVGLRKNKDAVQYLLDRGVTKATMVDFRVGFAPDGWDTLYRMLKGKGFSDDVMKKAGLITSGKKGYIDWFRDRIMFPIMDAQGRVVGFTGRIFLHPHEKDNPPEHKQKTGKYINSPETPVYEKSKILFGYDKAKRAIMQSDACLIVEGQMDVVMSHQAGTNYTVALSGTALTAEQLRLIRRFTDRVVYALDADAAGREALRKGAMLAYAEGMIVQVLELSTGTDPADYIKDNGNEAWEKKLLAVQDYIAFETKKLAEEISDDREQLKRIQTVLFPVIRFIESSIGRDVALKGVAHAGGYDIDAVRNDFKKYAAENKIRPSVPVVAQSPVQAETKGQPVEEIMKEILAIIWWQEEVKKIEDIGRFYERLERMIESIEHAKIDPGVYVDRKDTLVFEADLRYDGLSEEKLSQELEHLLRQLHVNLLQQERIYVMQLIDTAEAQGDEASSHENLKQYQALSRKIEDLKALEN
jgi:DNA primase